VPVDTGPSLHESTYVALSSTPNADGRQWVYLMAPGPEEASILAQRWAPSPHYIFKLPTQRTKTAANLVLRYGPAWILGTLALVTYLTIHFRQNGLGFVVFGWPQAFGFALLFLATVILLMVSYLAALDVACSRAGSRMLRLRSTKAPDGSVIEPTGIEDILDAYGPVRMGRAVLRVNIVFVAGLLGLILAANFLR
jgi:hypothetical protein